MARRVIDGVLDAQRRIDRVVRNLRSHQVAAAAGVAILPMQNDAKRRAPVLTGNLRRSITVQRQRLRPGVDQLLLGTDVEYARWIELGTLGVFDDRLVGSAAQPYLRPAYDKKRHGFQKDYARALGVIVTRGL